MMSDVIKKYDELRAEKGSRPTIDEIRVILEDYRTETGEHISYGKFSAALWLRNGKVTEEHINTADERILSDYVCKGLRKPTRRLTAGEHEEIRKLYRDGVNIYDIASMLNFDIGTVRRHLKDIYSGTAINKNHNVLSWTEENRQKLKDMYLAGKTYKEISEVLGCTASAAQRKVSDLGLYKIKADADNGRFKWDEYKFQTLRRMYFDGKSYEDISKALGCTVKTARQKAYDTGLTKLRKE